MFCTSKCPGTHYVDYVGLELTEIRRPASLLGIGTKDMYHHTRSKEYVPLIIALGR